MSKELVTVESLRKQGYKVRCIHYRPVETEDGQLEEMSRFTAEFDGLDWNPLPFGGATVVEINSPTGEKFEATAECSYKDNFNRKVGLQLALARALKDKELTIDDLPPEFQTEAVVKFIRNESLRINKENMKRQIKLQLLNQLKQELGL